MRIHWEMYVTLFDGIEQAMQLLPNTPETLPAYLRLQEAVQAAEQMYIEAEG